ncbi:MAG: TolC family protein [Gammaproteobacteria bacterium]|nr:TolC family protein [Gammaproteobacteria bacterium]
MISEGAYFIKQIWLLLILLSLLSGCAGQDRTFRDIDIPPFIEESNLEALHDKDPDVPLIAQPQKTGNKAIGEGILYAPRPYLMPTSAAAKPGSSAEQNKSQVSLSLAETIMLGLRQNNAIKSAYLARVVNRFSLHIAEGEFVPRWTEITGSTNLADSQNSDSLGLGTNFSWETPYGTSFGLGLSTSTDFPNTANTESSATTSMTATLSQPLMRGFGTEVNTATLQQARISEVQNRLSLKSTVSATITALINAFLGYEAQKWNLDIAQRSLDRNKKLLQGNKLLVQAGHMAVSELIQTELSVSNSEISLNESKNSLNNARLALLNLLSLDPDLELITSMEINPTILRIDLNKAKEQAYKTNPAYLSQQIGVESAMIALRLARENLRWQLDLEGNYTLSGSGGNTADSIDGLDSESATWSVGLNLVIPLDMRDFKQEEVASEVALEQAKLNLDEVRENLDSSVRNSVIEVENSWQRLLISKRSLSLAQQTLNTEVKKLSVGKSSSFEVLARHLTLREAESAELNAVVTYHNSLAALDEVLGTTLDTWQIKLNDY